jgi:uncharacterized protein
MSDASELDRHRYLSLATFRRNGTEVATPVWFTAVGDRLYVVTSGDAGKVKRLHNSARARVAPCDVRGRVSGAWREASARVIDAAAMPPARAALLKKYGWQVRLLDLFSRLTGRIHRAWIEIALRP